MGWLMAMFDLPVFLKKSGRRLRGLERRCWTTAL